MQERVILQFGRVGKHAFTMDYAYPLTGLQARPATAPRPALRRTRPRFAPALRPRSAPTSTRCLSALPTAGLCPVPVFP